MARGRSAAMMAALLGLSITVTLLLSSLLDRTRPLLALASWNASTSPGLLDLREFHYLVEAAPCGEQQLAALLVVTSHAGHVEVRSAARRAYPAPQLAALRVRRVFLLAVPRTSDPDFLSQAALLDEARRFGDLVQGDFLEAYRNLSYKHVMGLRWAAERCPLAEHIVKMDDDIVVDLPRLMRLLAGRQGVVSLLGFLLAGRAPLREPRSKWFVTQQEYPGDLYPPFLSGWLYVTTTQVAGRLAHVAAQLPYFWIDDVFVTGLAAQRAGVAHQDIHKVFASHVELLQCCLASDRYECDFVVGPNGGQVELAVKFAQHGARCHQLRCPRRPAHKSLRRTCVVTRTASLLDQGHALVQQLQLS